MLLRALSIALFIGFGGVAFAEEPAPLGVLGLSADQIDAAKTVIETQTADLVKGDMSAYASYWAEDGVLMPIDKTRLTGRDDIVSYVEANFAKGLQIAYSEWEATGSGDLAVLINNAAVTQASGKVLNLDQIMVLRQQSDGSWLVQAAIWTLDGLK